MANEDNNGFTDAEKAILKIRLEEYDNGTATLEDIDSAIRRFGFDPVALRTEIEAEYKNAVLEKRISSLDDGSVQGISFSELLERVRINEAEIESTHGDGRGGPIQADLVEIRHQLGSLSPRTTTDKD